MKKYFLYTSLIFMLASCKQDFVNPNEALEVDAYGSPNALSALTNGLQRVYALALDGSRYNAIIGNGCITNEFVLRNSGNVNEANLFTGGSSVDNLNGIVNSLWISSNKIIYEADRVIDAAKKLGDKNYAAGLIARASIYKALAIGDLATFWENIPSTPGNLTSAATFQTRNAALLRAVQVLTDAQTFLATNPASTAVIGTLPTGIDYVHVFNALKARYYLFAGDYTNALAAANTVSLTVKNDIRYDGVNGINNPIFALATATNNVVQAIDSTLGLVPALQTAITDKRIPFYTSINSNTATPPRFRINGFFNANTTSIPIYLPDEIPLIKAECYLRQATPDLMLATTELNAVITQVPSADAYGIGADLPALPSGLTQQQLLDETYKQRCVELYMSGMKIEDMRRFSRPVAERKRSFFPYPFRERDNNPNTPADPAF
jgi:starch-binding outer membrane protein, SusD/RagB family